MISIFIIVTIALAGIAGGGVISHLMGQMNDPDSKPFYDRYRTYYRFPVEYTDLIDATFLKNRNRACY